MSAFHGLFSTFIQLSAIRRRSETLSIIKKIMTTENPAIALSPGQYGLFDDMYETWSASKVLAMIAFVITQTLGNLLLLGIVWYEKFGSDRTYRTVLNQLTSAFCSMLIVMNLTLTNLIAIAHIFGPLGDKMCNVLVFSSNFFLTLGLLYLDTIVILRYLYIFRWKTAGGLNDHLFSTFFTVNFVVISFLFCCLLYALGFNHNINYFICVNKMPLDANLKDDRLLHGNSTSSLSQPMFRVPAIVTYDIFCILPVFSYLVHLFVFVKIFLFQRRRNNMLKDNNANNGIQTVSVQEIMNQNRNVTELVTSMVVMGLILVSCVPTVLIMVYFKPHELLHLPGEACLFFGHFGMQFVVSILLPLTHYARNKNLRHTVAQRIQRKGRFSHRQPDDQSRSTSPAAGGPTTLLARLRDRFQRQRIPQTDIAMNNI